jgi:flap endonuclease-1
VDKIRDIFLHPEVTDDYEIKWRKPEPEKLIEFLCDDHNFSIDRVEKAAERLKASSGARQKTLDQWF